MVGVSWFGSRDGFWRQSLLTELVEEGGNFHGKMERGVEWETVIASKPCTHSSQHRGRGTRRIAGAERRPPSFTRRPAPRRIGLAPRGAEDRHEIGDFIRHVVGILDCLPHLRLEDRAVVAQVPAQCHAECAFV